jgi:hypothetical protein
MQQLLWSLGPGVGCSDERAGLGADDSGTGGAVLDHVRWQT